VRTQSCDLVLAKPFDSFVGPLLSPLPKVMLASKKLFEEEIKHRIQMDDEYGKKYDGRPVSLTFFYVVIRTRSFISQNDLFSWLLDAAPQDERKVENLILRLHIVNMGAVHTVANVCLDFYFFLLFKSIKVIVLGIHAGIV
jgi:hypothetical protein